MDGCDGQLICRCEDSDGVGVSRMIRARRGSNGDETLTARGEFRGF
jgi:hypothetical protein